MYLPGECLDNDFTYYGLSALLYVTILGKECERHANLKVRNALDAISHLENLVIREVISY